MLTKFHDFYRRLSQRIPVVGRYRIFRFLKQTRPAASTAEDAVSVRHAPVVRPPETEPLLAPAAAMAETPPTVADPLVMGMDWSGGIGSIVPGGDDETMAGNPASAASLQQWISAGVLYPEEIKQAEKLIRDMRQRP